MRLTCLKRKILIMKKVLTLGVVLTTILWTMGFAAFVPVASAATLSAGDLIKASGPAVYFYAEDGKRYTFPTQSTYMTWYTDFSSVKTITDDELAAIDLAGNVVVRPGTKLVKITTVPKVFAVEPNGKLTWVKTEAAAKALYGDNWAKTVIDVPDGFWVNYTDAGTELDGTAYPAGQLVKYADSADIFYVNADGTKSLISSAGFTANKWNSAFVVTAPATISMTSGSEITERVATLVDSSQGGGAGVVVPGVSGSVAVSLSAMTPGASNIPTNATSAAANVPMTKLNFTAGSSDVTVTGVKVTRSNLSQDAALSAVKLFDGTTQLGTSQNLNATHQAVFSNISLVVPANTTKTLTLSATMTLSADYNGNIIVLGVNSASDITSTASVSGSFPVNGNSMTLNSGVTIGSATLYNGALGTRNTTDLTVDGDAKDVRFTQVRITAGSAENLTVSQVVAIKNGTAANGDVQNIRLVNDTTGATVATLDSLNASGRAVFDTSIAITKGQSVDLSVIADMAGSGSGRTIAFDLHDGTAYTISLVGATYGFGITPERSTFCAAAGTCTAQTINQGYLIVNLSGTTASAGFIAPGATQVPLATLAYEARGEDINVTNTAVRITVTGAVIGEVTNVTLYDENGSVLAGPQNPVESGTSFSLTNAYTVPVGAHNYVLKADIASTVASTETVVASMEALTITARGSTSGRTTYTTSSGSTVPPASVITGKTQTVRAAALTCTTAATPVAGDMVINAQDATFANFVMDSSAGGEDVRISSLIVSDAVADGAAVGDILNLEIWGDPDTTDATDEVKRLETTNSTATNAATVTFTFRTPIVVSKMKSNTLTLKADITSGAAATGTHTFNIANTAGHVVATGNSTGNDITEVIAGTGQAQTMREIGTLLVTASSTRPSAAQFVAGTTGSLMMSYKLQSTYEEIDITEFYVATDAAANGDVSKVKVYLDGTLIGQTNGYDLDDNGNARIVLDSGTVIVPKTPSYKTLDIKVDLANKENLGDGGTLEIGLGDSTGPAYDSEWGADGAVGAGSYSMVATGKSSGTAITPANITSTGAAGGTVVASYMQYLYDGVLVVTKNNASPSGVSTGGPDLELLRLDLKAVGDDIIVGALEFCYSGIATNAAGTGNITLKSSNLGTTYGTITPAEFDAYWDDFGGDGLDLDASVPWKSGVDVKEQCISFGNATYLDAITVYNQATQNTDSTGAAMDALSTLEITSGTTVTVRLFGDTTGFTTSDSLTVSLRQNATAANLVTVGGLVWQNSGGTDVDSALTKELPVVGNSFTY